MTLPESSIAPSTSPAPGAGPVPRILLVDDDLINQKVLVGLLKRKGWETAAAASGRKCLELLTQQAFDLVLMDIQMPEMDGYETARRIRDQEASGTRPPPTPLAASAPSAATPRVPIVALTTVSQPGTRERCLECGMDDHLTKPVQTQALYTTIQRLLQLPAPTGTEAA